MSFLLTSWPDRVDPVARCLKKKFSREILKAFYRKVTPSPPRTDVESPPKGPTRGSGEPPEGRPKNPGREKIVLQSPLKGPTRGSDNFAQNVGPCGGGGTLL